jgi:hypothetical protein
MRAIAWLRQLRNKLRILTGDQGHLLYVQGTGLSKKLQMTTDGTRNFGFVLLMTLVGLLSGMVTAAVCDANFGYGLGAPFGLVVACFLLVCGIVRDPLKAIAIVALSTAAFFVSVFFAEFLELGLARLGLPAGEWSFMSGVVRPPAFSLVAGGTLGAFMFLLGTLLLIRSSENRLAVLIWNAFAWSTLGGVTAPVAWALGPSLGLWVWLALHSAGLTSPRNTFQNAVYNNDAYGAPNHLYALFIVWQTGVAFALGWNLRSVQHQPSQNDLRPSILT